MKPRCLINILFSSPLFRWMDYNQFQSLLNTITIRSCCKEGLKFFFFFLFSFQLFAEKYLKYFSVMSLPTHFSFSYWGSWAHHTQTNAISAFPGSLPVSSLIHPCHGLSKNNCFLLFWVKYFWVFIKETV